MEVKFKLEEKEKTPDCYQVGEISVALSGSAVAIIKLLLLLQDKFKEF